MSTFMDAVDVLRFAMEIDKIMAELEDDDDDGEDDGEMTESQALAIEEAYKESWRAALRSRPIHQRWIDEVYAEPEFASQREDEKPYGLDCSALMPWNDDIQGVD